MQWIKSLWNYELKFMSLSILLLVVTCHFTIFGASLSIVLLYLSFLFYTFNKRSEFIKIETVWLGYLIFFLGLLVADILSENSKDSVALFFQKRLPLWSIALVIPIAFNKVDDVQQLIKYFLIVGVITSAVSIVNFLIFVLPEGGRLIMFTHYMTSGGMTMMLSLLLLGFSVGSGIPKKWRLFSLIGLVICLMALVATSTRSSWLGFILGAIIIALFKKKELIYILIIGIIGFFFLAPASVQDRIESIWNPKHPNNVGRLNMWETGIEIWKDNKWFGVGDHDLKEIYAAYKKADDNETGGHLHNTIVMWLVTTGVLGFATVIIFISTIILTLIRTIKKSEEWFSKSLTVSVLACFSGFLLNGMFEWNFGDSEIITYISILLGFCWIIYTNQKLHGATHHAV